MKQSRLIHVCLSVALWLLLGVGGYALTAAAPQARTNCTNGMAGAYPCAGVDMLANLPLNAIGAEDSTVFGNDHWGWTDPQTNRQYVIFGLTLLTPKTLSTWVNSRRTRAHPFIGTLRFTKTLPTLSLTISPHMGCRCLT